MVALQIKAAQTLMLNLILIYVREMVEAQSVLRYL